MLGFGVGFGFRLLTCLAIGSFIASNKEEDLVLKFNSFVFFLYILPPIVLSAGMQLDLRRFRANLMTILFRGILLPCASFALVSIGAVVCLPILGIRSIAATDCLAIGSLFASTNFLFCFEDIKEGRENMRSLYEIAVAESIFNTATSLLLYKLVQNMDVMTLKPSDLYDLVANFGHSVVVSTFLGFMIPYAIIYANIGTFMLLDPERRRFYLTEGALRKDEGGMATVVHACIMFWVYLLYLITEPYQISNIIVMFYFGILTSHNFLPKTATGYKVTLRHDIPIIVDYVESPIYLWLGCCVANSDHWTYVFSSFATIATFLSATCLLFVLLVVGRAPSVLHFSRHVMTRVETEEKGTNTYLFNRWRISDVELDKQVIIWWSGFMPSVVSVCLALDRFGNSKEPHHAYILTSICTVVYLTSLVYCIVMWSSLKEDLARSMIKLRNNALLRDKYE